MLKTSLIKLKRHPPTFRRFEQTFTLEPVKTFLSAMYQWLCINTIIFHVVDNIKSAAFSAIIIVGALVLPPITVGIIDASTTLKLLIPLTRSSGSTTDISSIPILQVPTG